jgi:hypothetical protein
METITISWLVNKAWILLVGVYLYSKRISDQENKDRDTKIASLEMEIMRTKASFVTEEQMKSAIKEALEPYREDQLEIKDLLTKLTDQVNAISRDIAVQTAIRSGLITARTSGNGDGV